MKQWVLILFAAAVCAVLFLSCNSGSARTVTVTGSGTVSVIPDTANIQLSVVTRSSSVREAAAENAQRMTEVQNAIQNANVPRESIFTSDYTMRQEYSYVNGKSIPGDYRVSNMLTVVLKDVTKAGEIIDAAIGAGANELTSLSFSAANVSEAEDQARALAVEQARHAAELLAQSGGAKLGRMISVSEESYSQPAMQSNKMLAADYSQSVTPVTAGKSNVTVTVRAVFALR